MNTSKDGLAMSRRQAIKLGSLGAALSASFALSSNLMGCSKASEDSSTEKGNKTSTSKETIKWGNCAVNCGGRCALQFHLRDNEIVYVESDTQGDPSFGKLQTRACPRGRSMRHLLNSPERLNYPMKRVGKRGEGKFERISWEEAFDTIANQIKRVSQNYGNEAIWISYATGIYSPTGRPWHRLLNQVGGYLNMYGSYSSAQISAGLPYSIGSKDASNILAIEDASLVVFFGNNLTEMRMAGVGNGYFFKSIRDKKNIKVIHIDPRYTETNSGYADQWIAIRPGTDSALVCALAYELIQNKWTDEEFLANYCVGYDKSTMPKGYESSCSYKDYILGLGADKTAKTPEWASSITGIPVDTIKNLAKEIGTTKPLFVAQGLGPQRHANGENTARCISMLPILTGQIGLPGTNTGSQEISGVASTIADLPKGTNPIKTSISCFDWPRAILEGSKMTALNGDVKGADKLSTEIKLIINHGGNCLTNQHGEINTMHEILSDESKLEFLVCCDIVMTDSCKYADILLPDLARSEQPNIGTNGYSDPVEVIFSGDEALSTEKFERKSGYDICTEIAKRLGVEQSFTEGLDQRGWIKRLFEEARSKRPDFPSYEDLQEMGVWKQPVKPYIGLEQFRKDPLANPLKTSSGKIEIFSSALEDISKTWELEEGDKITALPEFYLGFDGWDSPRKNKYPFQLIGYHFKGRCHSSYANLSSLQEVYRQTCWVNTLDAQKLGIKDGDWIKVFNDYGEVHIPAKVTPRIIPGTCAMPQGAWHKADMAGDKIDKGGCINTLTKNRPSPLAKGNPSHTNHVQIEALGGSVLESGIDTLTAEAQIMEAFKTENEAKEN